MIFHDVLNQRAMKKIAINMADLRKAYKARVSPYLVRTTKGERGRARALLNRAKGGPLEDSLREQILGQAAVTAHKAPIAGISDSLVQANASTMAADLARALPNADPAEIRRLVGADNNVAGASFKRLKSRIAQTRDKDAVIIAGGDTGRTLNDHVLALSGDDIPKAKTPAGREAVNRMIGLHEASEMSSMRNAHSRGAGPTFMSHQGPQPMLNDVNIANTFEGPGAADIRAQVSGMRGGELAALKRELKSDPRAVELIEKLQGGGRINRHQRKYIDKMYARLVLGRPV